MASRIPFTYLKNILISRLYKKFSGNVSAMAPKNFKLSKYKHIIYSFEARDLEISSM